MNILKVSSDQHRAYEVVQRSLNSNKRSRRKEKILTEAEFNSKIIFIVNWIDSFVGTDRSSISIGSKSQHSRNIGKCSWIKLNTI